MTNYRRLAVAWALPLVFTTSSIISLAIWLGDHSTAQGITLGIAGSILVVGLIGWIHFRIEWMQLLKGKHVMTDDDIKFYGYDPINKDNEYKARKKKIFVFEMIMTFTLITSLLVGIPALG